MRSPRTAHDAPVRHRLVPLGDYEWRLPGKAQTEDQKTRAAWLAGRKQKSPYLSIVQLPGEVRPGDHAQALAILDRVEQALAITGRWTKDERRRLRAMKGAWERRAAGTDAKFNLIGWQSTGAAWWRAEERKRAGVGRLLNEMRQEIGE